MRRTLMRSASLLAGAATVLALTACAEDDPDEPAPADSGQCDAPEDSQAVHIGAFSGWEEGIVATYLWKAALEEAGYTATVEFADVGPLYLGMAQCAYDIGFDAWLPATHEDYWSEHGESLEDLGVWFDDAPLTIAVNQDAPIQSLAELAGAADEFGNRIVGIESGAGLTRITRENVIPSYGLEDMDFIESSTAAMLTELRSATAQGENIAVTLWQPHWAYDAFPIRNLDDPENALGDPEEIHAFGRSEFGEDYPEIADWVAAWSLDAETLHAIENHMFNQNQASTEEEYEATLADWLAEHPDLLSSMTG